eukprot:TRINITY_DN11113_c0_g1_i1.p1 TRINITY_DN11113_c0_g1~~TRINITY_DN11113_c0_g1_i1.p1  ORF type:complete len:754 (+),score=262.25 TRINITY_DN11113_c0_g1_i1:123-2384(+)
MAFTKQQADDYAAYLAAKEVGRLVDAALQECCRSMPAHPATHVARFLTEAHVAGTEFPKAGGQHALSGGGVQIAELGSVAAVSVAGPTGSPVPSPLSPITAAKHRNPSVLSEPAADPNMPKVSGRGSIRFDKKRLSAAGWVPRICQGLSSFFVELRAHRGAADSVLVTHDPRDGNSVVLGKLQRCLVANKLKPVLAEHVGSASPSAAAVMYLRCEAAAAGGEEGTRFLGGVVLGSNLPLDTLSLSVLNAVGGPPAPAEVDRMEDQMRRCESWLHITDLGAATYEGAIRHANVLGRYVNALDALFDFDAMAAGLAALLAAGDPVAVVVDCSHGTVGPVLREILFRRLGLAEHQHAFLLRETPRIDLGFPQGTDRASDGPRSKAWTPGCTAGGERLWSAAETRLVHTKDWIAANGGELPATAARRANAGACLSLAMSVDGTYSALGDTAAETQVTKAEELCLYHMTGMAPWVAQSTFLGEGLAGVFDKSTGGGGGGGGGGGAGDAPTDGAFDAMLGAGSMYEQSVLTPPSLHLLLEAAGPDNAAQAFRAFAAPMAAPAAALPVTYTAPFAQAEATGKWTVHEETHTLANPYTQREDAVFNMLLLLRVMLLRKMTLKDLLGELWGKCGRVYYARGLLWCRSYDEKTQIRRILDALCAAAEHGVYSGLRLLSAAAMTPHNGYQTWALRFEGDALLKAFFAHSSSHGTGLQVHCYVYRTAHADTPKAATQPLKNAFSEVLRQSGWEGAEAFTDAELYL